MHVPKSVFTPHEFTAREQIRGQSVLNSFVRNLRQDSVNDLAQTIFRRAVAIVGVRMMPLHQGLEFGLDLGRRGLILDAQRVARLALSIVHNPRFAPAGLLALRAGAEMPE